MEQVFRSLFAWLGPRQLPGRLMDQCDPSGLGQAATCLDARLGVKPARALLLQIPLQSGASRERAAPCPPAPASGAVAAGHLVLHVHSDFVPGRSGTRPGGATGSALVPA